MSDINDILTKAGNKVLQEKSQLPPTSKANAVAAASDIKKANLVELSSLARNVVTSARTGDGYIKDNQMEYDLQTLTQPELALKYGQDTADAAQGAIAEEAINSDLLAHRDANVSGLQQTKDFGLSVVSGVANLGLGLAQMGSLVTPYSNEVAEFAKGTNEFIDSGLSDASLAERERKRLANEMSDRDRQQQYYEDRASGGGEIGSKIAREFSILGDRLSNIGDYGLSDAQVVGSAVGSIGGIGLATKAIAKGGGALADSVLSEAGAKAAAEMGNKIRYPAMVGLSEGGGAASDATNRVLAMAPEVIAKTEEYRALKAENPNLTHQEIVESLARSAGIDAGITTGLIAAPLGLITKFNDKAIMPTAGSLKGIAAQAGLEATEEVPQGIVGNIATNSAVRRYGDETQDELKGTGQAAYDSLVGSLGATLGLNAGGIVKGGASVATDITKGTLGVVGKVLGKAVSGASNAIGSVSVANSAAKIVDKAKTVGQNVAAARTAVAAMVPEITKSAAKIGGGSVIDNPAIDSAKLSTEEVAKIGNAEFTAKLADALELVIPEELLGQLATPKVANALRGVPTVGEAVTNLSKVITEADSTEEDRINALEHMANWITDATGTLELGKNLISQHGSYAPLQKFQTAMSNDLKEILDSPLIAQHRSVFADLYNRGIKAGYITEINPTNLSNPATQEAELRNIDRNISLAMASDSIPDTLGKNAGVILQMVETGNVQLTDKQAKALAAIEAMYKIGAELESNANTVGALGTGFVSRQVIHNTLNDKDIHNRGMGNRLSLRGHVNGIVSAIMSGDELAKNQRLNALRAFIVKHNTKADAVDTHVNGKLNGTLKDGDRTPYSNTKIGKKGLDVKLGSAASVQNAIAIQTEAKLLSESYEKLVKAFGVNQTYNLPAKWAKRKIHSALTGQGNNTNSQTENQTDDTTDDANDYSFDHIFDAINQYTGETDNQTSEEDISAYNGNATSDYYDYMSQNQSDNAAPKPAPKGNAPANKVDAAINNATGSNANQNNQQNTDWNPYDQQNAQPADNQNTPYVAPPQQNADGTQRKRININNKPVKYTLDPSDKSKPIARIDRDGIHIQAGVAKADVVEFLRNSGINSGKTSVYKEASKLFQTKYGVSLENIIDNDLTDAKARKLLLAYQLYYVNQIKKLGSRAKYIEEFKTNPVKYTLEAFEFATKAVGVNLKVKTTIANKITTSPELLSAYNNKPKPAPVAAPTPTAAPKPTSKTTRTELNNSDASTLIKGDGLVVVPSFNEQEIANNPETAYIYFSHNKVPSELANLDNVLVVDLSSENIPEIIDNIKSHANAEFSRSAINIVEARNAIGDIQDTEVAAQVNELLEYLLQEMDVDNSSNKVITVNPAYAKATGSKSEDEFLDRIISGEITSLAAGGSKLMPLWNYEADLENPTMTFTNQSGSMVVEVELSNPKVMIDILDSDENIPNETHIDNLAKASGINVKQINDSLEETQDRVVQYELKVMNYSVGEQFVPSNIKEDKTPTKPAKPAKTAGSTKGTTYSWARTSKNGYEVSTDGDTRFSALNAKLKDGRTIEEAYQLDIKGYRSQGNDWRLGKGKPPLNKMSKEDMWKAYKNLWKTFLDENPDLKDDLAEKAKGKVLTDKFANTEVSQARALAELLNESNRTGSTNKVGQDKPVVEEVKLAPTATTSLPQVKANPVQLNTNFAKDQTKANYADGIIAYGEGSTGKYAEAFGGTRTSFKAGEVIMISVNGRGRENQEESIQKTKDAIDLALSQGVTTFIADNSSIANSAHNASGEGVIRKYLLEKGLEYTPFKEVGLYTVSKNISTDITELHQVIGSDLSFGNRNPIYSSFVPSVKSGKDLLFINNDSPIKAVIKMFSGTVSSLREVAKNKSEAAYLNVDNKLLGHYKNALATLSTPLKQGFVNLLNKAIAKGKLTEKTGLTSIATIIASELEETQEDKQITGIRRAIAKALPNLKLNDAKAVKALAKTYREYTATSVELKMLLDRRKKLQEEYKRESEVTKSGMNTNGLEPEIVKEMVDNKLYPSILQAKIDSFNDKFGARIEELQGIIDSYEKDNSSNAIQLRALRSALVSEYNSGSITNSSLVVRKELQTISDGRAFAITDTKYQTDKNGNTNIELTPNTQLLETAVIAAIQWLIHQSVTGGSSSMDKETISEVSGIPEEEITYDIMKLFTTSQMSHTVLQSLSKTIKDVMQIKDRTGSSYLGVSQGVIGSIASTLLDVMVENSDMFGVTLNSVQYTNELNSTKTLNMFSLTYGNTTAKDESGREVKNNVFSTEPSLITNMVSKENQDNVFIGSPEGMPSKSTINRSNVKLSEEQKEVIKKANEVEFKINAPMVKLYEAIGLEGLTVIAGAEQVDPNKVNKNTLVTRIGQNVQIASAYKKLMRTLGKVRAYATDNEIEDTEVPIHYPHGFISNSRLQQDSSFSPQASKVTRAAISSTMRTVDLTEEKNEQLFFIALAQGLGIKVHNLKYPEVKKQLDKLIAEPEIKEGLRAIRYVLDDTSDQYKVVVSKLARAYGKAGGSIWGISSLVEYQRYVQAKEAGTLAEFSTSAAIEADGMTNGTANALHIMNGHFLTETDVENWIKTGFYVGNENTNANEERTKNPTDIYLTAAKVFEKHYLELRDLVANELKDKVKTATKKFTKDMIGKYLSSDMSATFEMIEAYSPTVKIDKDKGTITFQRNFSKQPMTVSVYGASIKTMSNYVIDDIVDNIYQKISDHLDGTKLLTKEEVTRFNNMLRAASSSHIAESMFNGYYIKPRLKVDGTIDFKPDFPFIDLNRRETLTEFTLKGQAEKYIRENLSFYVSRGLAKTLQSVLGTGLLDSMGAVIAVSSSHSYIMAEKFNNEILDARLEEPSNGTKYSSNDFINRNSLNRVIDGVYEEFNGVYQGNNQSFAIADSEAKSDLSVTPVGASLSGKYATYATIPSIVGVGVKGSPTLNIGNGDASMVQRYIAKLVKALNALFVYDGIEFSITDIMEQSPKINEAVFESWTENNAPAQLYEATKDLVQMLSPDLVTRELVDTLKRSMGGHDAVINSYDDLVAGLENQIFKLGVMADIIDARQQVVKTIGSSVHQMASVEAPYQHKGIDLSNKSPKEIADYINNEIIKILKDKGDSLRTNRDIKFFEYILKYEMDIPPSSMSYKEMEEITKAIDANNSLKAKKEDKLNTPAPSSVAPAPAKPIEGAKGVAELLKEIKTKPNLTAEHKRLIAIIERLGELNPNILNTSILLSDGNNLKDVVDKISNLSQAEKDKTVSGLEDAAGVFIYSANTIVIKDGTKDYLTVLAHELVHAATVKAIDKSIINGKIPDGRTKEGKVLSKINELMQEFLSSDFAKLMEQTDTAGIVEYNTAVDAIKAHQNNNSLLGSLAEFIAYALTTERISKVAKENKGEYFLAKVKNAVMSLVRKVLGLPVDAAYANNFLDSLEFHTLILADMTNELEPTPTPTPPSNGTNTFQSKIGTRSTSGLLGSAMNKLASIEANLKKKGNSVDLLSKLTEARKDVDNLIKLGFHMNSDQAQLYTLVSTIVEANRIEDAAVINQLSNLHRILIQELNLHDFAGENAVDTIDTAMLYQDMYNVLLDNNNSKRTASNLAIFAGLLAASPDLQRAANNVLIRVKPKEYADIVDKTYGKLGELVMNTITSESNKEGSVDALGMKLIDKLLSIKQDNNYLQGAVANTVTNAVSSANNFIANQMQVGIEKFINANAAFAKSQHKFNPIAIAGNITAVALSTLHERLANELALDINSGMNKIQGFEPLRDLLSDLIGRTTANGSIYDLIKPVKTFVAKTRQVYRVAAPQRILKAFKKEPTKEQLATMTKVLGKTGLYHLGVHTGLSILKDRKRIPKEIDSLKTKLAKSYSRAELDYIEEKVQQIAEYNTTGVIGSNYLRNAYAISRLFGYTDNPKEITSKAIPKYINSWIALESLQRTDSQAVNEIIELNRTENAGLVFALTYMEGIDISNAAKADAFEIGKYNQYYGFLNQERLDSADLKVMPLSQHRSMLLQGYTRLEDYVPDSRDIHDEPRAYYYRAASPINTFSQGIIQNIQETVGGVSKYDGISINNIAGIITNEEEIDAISNSVNSGSGENLLPVFDEAGSIIAYERTAKSDILNKIEVETDITRVLGNTRGRQIEEYAAQTWNLKIVDTLQDMYQNDRNKDEYVNVLDYRELKRDPVLRDAVGLFSKGFENTLREVTGGNLYIKRELIREVVGYRKASVTDVFTGNSRLSPEVINTARDAAIAVFGENAFNILSTTEAVVQEGVMLLKTLISIKSVVVPVANILGNIIHLASTGVDIVKGTKMIPTVVREVEDYMKNQKRLVDIEAEYLATSDVILQRRLRAEKASILSSIDKLKIKPLIDAGELSGVNDVGNLDEDDIVMVRHMNKDLRKLVNKWVDATPDGVKLVGKHLLITKDTELFKGLQKTVMYGDFVAKAILYYDLLDKGKTSEEARIRVQEEFVNYDKLAGRSRDYLESMGLLWFYNFKLRSIKVALNVLRRNPLHALMFTGGIGMPMDIGTALTDNAAGLFLDNSLGYSVGIDMGLNGISLNPYRSLVF